MAFCIRRCDCGKYWMNDWIILMIMVIFVIYGVVWFEAAEELQQEILRMFAHSVACSVEVPTIGACASHLIVCLRPTRCTKRWANLQVCCAAAWPTCRRNVTWGATTCSCQANLHHQPTCTHTHIVLHAATETAAPLDTVQHRIFLIPAVNSNNTITNSRQSRVIHHSFISLLQQMSKRIRRYIWLKHITIMLLGK